MKEKKGEQGFTLIELITVIFTVAILAAVAVTKFTDLSETAKVSACKKNQSALTSAQQMFFAEQTLSGKEAKYANNIKELEMYFVGNELPTCPSGGKYKPSNKSAIVPCNFKGHSPDKKPAESLSIENL